MISRAARTLAAAVAAGLLLTGCGGGDDGPDREGSEGELAEFIERGDRVCRDVLSKDARLRRALLLLARPETQQTARYLNEGAGLQRRRARLFAAAADRLRALGEPPTGRSAFEAYVAGVEQVAALQGRLSDLARLGDRVRYDALSQELLPIAARTGGIAQGYGFQVCGSGLS